MANTLKDQIDNLVGVQLASTLYDNWIVAGARTIVDILKQEDLERHSSSVAVPITTGLAVSLYRIWRVLVGGYDATQFTAGYETQLADSNSLLRSSAFTPAYIINAGTLKTYNGSNCAGTLIGIVYPTGIDSGVATDVAGVPENMHYGVILYAAIQARIKQLSELMVTTLAGLTRTIGTAPTALAAPAFTYSTAATTIGSLGTVPTYTKPTITMTTALADLDLSAITAPAVPSAPSIAYVDAAVTAVVAGTIGSLGIAPTYTKPAIGTLPTTLAITDLDTSAITAPVSPTLTVVAYVDAFGATVTPTTVASAPTAPSYTAVTTSAKEIWANIASYLSTLNTALVTTEDLELASGHYQRIDKALQEYQTLVQENLGAFNGTVKKFEGDLQVILQQGQTTLQQAIENAKASTEVSVQNKLQTMTAIIQNNNALLQKYQNDTAVYAQKINTAVNQYQANVQKGLGVYQANVKIIFDTWTLDIQNELNEYQKELALYQSTVQTAIKNADIASAKALSDGQSTNDIAKQNEAMTLQAVIEQYKETLAKYLGDLQRYQAIIASTVNQYQANTEKWKTQRATELQQYASDIQNELNEFQKELSIYQATVQVAIKDGEFALQKALQDGNQGLALQIQEYDAKIKRYSSELQKYQIDVQNIIAGFQSDVARTTAEHNGMLQGLQQLQSEYHGLISLYLGIPQQESK